MIFHCFCVCKFPRTNFLFIFSQIVTLVLFNSSHIIKEVTRADTRLNFKSIYLFKPISPQNRNGKKKKKKKKTAKTSTLHLSTSRLLSSLFCLSLSFIFRLSVCLYHSFVFTIEPRNVSSSIKT